MSGFDELWQQSPALQALVEAARNGQSILVEELWNSSKALIAALFQQATGKHVLIITGAAAEENKQLLDIPFFTQAPVVHFPAWETLPNEYIPPSPDIVGERYQVLRDIRTNPQPHIILGVLQACLQKLIIPPLFDDLYLELKVNTTISFEVLIDKFQTMGYKRHPVAADKGEFAIRGGIVDIFPVSSPTPYRLEFFGDDIESIRLYDPISQTSVGKADKVLIPPAQELELLQGQNTFGTILEYLGPHTVVILDDLLSVEDRAASLVSLGSMGTKYFTSFDELLQQIEPLQKVLFSHLPIEELSEVKSRPEKGYYSGSTHLTPIGFEVFDKPFQALRWRHPFATCGEFLSLNAAEGHTITSHELMEGLTKLPPAISLAIVGETERDKLHFLEKMQGASLPPNTHYLTGYLSDGLCIEDVPLLLFPLTELTHRYKIRRQKLRTAYNTAASQLFDLVPGELVVHLNNGIGKFLGIERRPNHQGHENEFLLLEYGEGAKLFVPIQQAHLVTKYIGATDDIPQLHQLGSPKWKKIKEHTQKAIVGYAKDLLDLYAQRQIRQGYACGPDSEDTRSFEHDFPFEETTDQLIAIDNVKTDMCSTKPMDRLICGDVGYGKTEVAMRAAFKAVVDGGKQVAVLVPTTVLAMQHYENFVERMGNFPINIGVLSRFRTPKQQKDTIQGVKQGTVDIVIGTHRIVSADVEFKNLGLVIIDEEQRFGVRAKEHLKKLKTNVDCLTLSATPIPRTLYMSLVGARDMSVINTPPEDRLPISTLIVEPSDEVIKNALLRELARDGQAFVIHNRVETIYGFADKVRRLLPHARIGIAHGQMTSDELDSIFHHFKHGEIDILFATTIIENGIDIPNANTILIDQADKYGLASLYQMRGRVGRWNRRAYAYLLVKNRRTLTEISRKRLQALAEAGAHGGGIKVAMRDLEIRGAGDILGTEQSGHVASIGFHFYCKLLKRTIEALQGKHPLTAFDVKIDFPVDARITDRYVNEVSLRMEIYQRLGESVSLHEVDAIWNELRDRFGPPPIQAEWLYHLSRIRVEAGQKGYTSLKWENMALTTERKVGQETVIRKQLLKPSKTPQALEEAVLKLL
ncbi:MAG: transcription-repair coupling factor [Parachlamydiales bacterium]